MMIPYHSGSDAVAEIAHNNRLQPTWPDSHLLHSPSTHLWGLWFGRPLLDQPYLNNYTWLSIGFDARPPRAASSPQAFRAGGFHVRCSWRSSLSEGVRKMDKIRNKIRAWPRWVRYGLLSGAAALILHKVSVLAQYGSSIWFISVGTTALVSIPLWLIGSGVILNGGCCVLQ